MGQLLRGSGKEITGQLGEENQNWMHHQNCSEFTAIPSRTLPESRQTDPQNGRDGTGLQVSPLVPAKEQESGTECWIQRWGRGAGLSRLSLQPSSSTQNSKKRCGKRTVTPTMSVC